jgi:hypothetical protein
MNMRVFELIQGRGMDVYSKKGVQYARGVDGVMTSWERYSVIQMPPAAASATAAAAFSASISSSVFPMWRRCSGFQVPEVSVS